MAAILIWRGGENSKRVEEVRSRLRAALAEKHPLESNLHPNLTTRISNSEANSQTALSSIREKTINHSATSIDEREIVPAAR